MGLLKQFRAVLIALLLVLLVGCSGGVSIEDAPASQTGGGATGGTTPGGGAGTVEAPNVPPTASITNPPEGGQYEADAAVTFEGSGVDLEDGTLTGEALVWVSGAEILATGSSFQKIMSEGEHSITLLVKDTEGATSSASADITVKPANTPPTVSGVTINGSIPAGDYRASTGIALLFNATASDTEDVSLPDTSYVWAINGSDNAYYETWTAQSFTVNNLSAGSYGATLTVTDSGGLSTESSLVTLTLTGDAPTPPSGTPNVSIESPTILSNLNGDTVVFYGGGTDSTGSTLSDDSLSWTVTNDSTGVTVVNSQAGAVLTVDDLPVGTYTATLTATDSAGNVTVTSTTITVTNTSPTASITSPVDGSGFIFGSSVTFSGTGSDAEEGSLSGVSLVWTSSLSSTIGFGASFNTSALAEGTHTITLTATDSKGAADTDSITVKIMRNNTAPTASITSPANGGAFTGGVYISFSGTGSDADGDALTYLWSSDGAAIGAGSSFTRSDLSDGAHVITLTVTDTKGATGTASATITVNPNNAPIVSITSPSDGAVYWEGDTITFSGSATDADGSVNSLLWTSGSTDIGTGASFTKSDLAVGAHTIALIAIDSSGAASTATVSITVKPQNQSPTVSITGPADRSDYASVSSITFSGSATDPEDGALSGSSLQWSTSMDDQIGTGASVTVSNLSIGTRTVTLTATDGTGKTGSASITISVITATPSDFVFYEDFAVDPNITPNRWTIYRNAGDNSKEAYYDSEDKSFYLTTANQNLGMAAFANYSLTANKWQADFDFNAGGGTAGGGDGFVFMFYKNTSCYSGSKPARGSYFGFICEDGTGGEGYGIEFDGLKWGDDYDAPHIALIKGNPISTANHLSRVTDSVVNSKAKDNEWHHVTVDFDNGTVKVYIDTDMAGAPVINHTVSGMDYTYSGIGFGAGTGSVTNNHIVKNFTVKIL